MQPRIPGLESYSDMAGMTTMYLYSTLNTAFSCFVFYFLSFLPFLVILTSLLIIFLYFRFCSNLCHTKCGFCGPGVNWLLCLLSVLSKTQTTELPKGRQKDAEKTRRGTEKKCREKSRQENQNWCNSSEIWTAYKWRWWWTRIVGRQNPMLLNQLKSGTFTTEILLLQFCTCKYFQIWIIIAINNPWRPQK